jgi:uncharacterized membrane protein
MVKYVFWVIFSALLGVAVHLAYILFVPSQKFSAQIDATLRNQGTNKFEILDAKLQAVLLPFATTDDLVGLCKFDVSKGPVKLAVAVPEGYWTLSIYTLHGKQVYALNGEQADTRNFAVTLSKSPSLVSQILGDDADVVPATDGDIGWRVGLTENQGLAFLWMPQSDQWQKKEAAELLKTSSCSLDGGSGS